jgi:hypothetical protein
MDLIKILTLYKSLFITYINSNIYILIDKCLLVSGYTLTTSSDNATVGLNFTFTCVTTETYITFNTDGITVCVITGSNTDGTCVLVGGYNTDYTYTCNPTTETYTVTIPGSYPTESLHGTKWRCRNPFGGGESNTKILYVNGEIFFLFFLIFVITTLVNIIIPPGTCLSYCDHLYGVRHWAYVIKHYEAK